MTDSEEAYVTELAVLKTAPLRVPVCRWCGTRCSTLDRGRYVCDGCGTAQHKPIWV